MFLSGPRCPTIEVIGKKRIHTHAGLTLLNWFVQYFKRYLRSCNMLLLLNFFKHLEKKPNPKSYVIVCDSFLKWNGHLWQVFWQFFVHLLNSTIVQFNIRHGHKGLYKMYKICAVLKKVPENSNWIKHVSEKGTVPR